MKYSESTWPAPSSVSSRMQTRSEALGHFFDTAKATAHSAQRLFVRPKGSPLDHPLLKALDRATEGHLIVITPEGRRIILGNVNSEPCARWHIHDWNVLDMVVARGEMGLAETYVTGKWDSEDLPAFLTYCLLNTKSLEKFFYGHFWYGFWAKLRNLFKTNSLRRSRRNVLDHYDLGNDFYALWLDESMTYSGALFEGEDRTLFDAQQAKYARIFQKLQLPPRAQVLDIGCGWGGFAEYAAREGANVTGITLSDEQRTFAVERMRKNALEKHADIRLEDYRNLIGMYDGIASIGMFEHVGMDHWSEFFATIKKHLKPGAKAVIQSIFLDDDVFERVRGKFGFVEQVIFPGGALPSQRAFVLEAEKAGLDCCGIFAFGPDYARTTRQWLKNFEAKKDDVKKLGYDNFFIRLWRFYLSCCIATFTSGRCGVMQVELVHKHQPLYV